MVCVTRFNPSCNGPLHLGHIYMVLVNEYFAHDRGGKFMVRFDDSHPMYRETYNVGEIVRQMRIDIEWLGVKVDIWQSQQEIMAATEAEMKARSFKPGPLFCAADSGPWVGSHRTIERYAPWPHEPRLTAEHVMMDYLAGVTHVIRGEDLITEYCLYLEYCDVMGIPRPKHYYLPRLLNSSGSDISKSAGGTTVAKMRAAGYTPENVHEILERGCLVLRDRGWELENLRTRPVVAL
jgi:glutamyl/glutaminyl-tRNA synthetase